MKQVDILGVPVAALTASEALAQLRQRIESGKRTHVVTVNAEIVMGAQCDADYRRVVAGADLRLADGIGIVWAAHYLRRRRSRGPAAYLSALGSLLQLAVAPRSVATELPATIPGADLVIDLAGLCEEFGYRLCLLGGGEGVAEAAAAKLQERFPKLSVVGALPGSPREQDDTIVRKTVAVHAPQVLLVAYGAPKQEYWIARNLPKLPAPCVAVGVGGTFDYLAGTTSVAGGRPAKQPPKLVRRRGLESFWRLFTQPNRWRRIVTALPIFVAHVVRHRRLILEKTR